MPKPTILHPWEKKLASVFPHWAMKRAQARIKMFRAEAAMVNRDRKTPVSPSQQNPESSVYSRDRIKLMLDARDLEENSAIASAIQLAIEEYGFGKIQYCARTGGGLAVDRVYNEFFSEWSKSVTSDKRFSLARLMQMGASSSCRDGDVGFHIVEGYPDDNGLPRVIPYESDRIGNVNATTAYTANYVSGLHLGDRGEITGVDIYARNDSSYVYDTLVPGNQFLMWTHLTRFDAYRGVTCYRPVITHIRDVKEIIEAEIAAVKWASGVAGVIQRQGGAKLDEDYFEDDSIPSVMSATAKLERLQHGRIEYLEADESFQQFQNARPAAAWQGFIQLMLRLASIGFNIPYSFLFDASGVMGTASRLDSARASRAFFRHQRNGKMSVLEPLKDLVIAVGIATKQLPTSPNPYNGSFLFAAHPTVDIGRESQANLAENRQGLKTALNIYGEQGQNVFEEQEQLAVEASNILELSKKYNVPVSMIQTLAKEGRTDADPIQGVHSSEAPITSQNTAFSWHDTDTTDVDPAYNRAWTEHLLSTVPSGSAAERVLLKRLSLLNFN